MATPIKKQIQVLSTLRRALVFLEPKERYVGLGLLLLMVLGALFEMASIGIVIPVVQLIGDPQAIENSGKLSWFYNFFQFKNTSDFFSFLLVSLFILFFVKNIYLALFQVLQSKLIRIKKVQLTKKLFSSYLDAPYEFHTQKNPSELFRNINYVSRFTDSVCMPLIVILSEVLVTAVVLSMMVAINPKTTLLALLFLGLAVAVFYFLSNKKIENWSQDQTYHTLQSTKWINQALGGIKEIKVFGKQKLFTQSYINHFDRLSRLTERINVVNQLPRLYIEILLVTALVVVIFMAIRMNLPLGKFLPTLAMFGLAAYRISPSLNRILVSAITLKGGLVIIDVLQNSLTEVDQVTNERTRASGSDPTSPVLFKRQIELAGLSFAYSGQERKVLKDFFLKIEKGSSVALVGHSGSGKSTLVDLILGVLHPSEGDIIVDGVSIYGNIKSWQKLLGYVPQQIFLSDDTIERNIAFGVDDRKINRQKVLDVARVCQLNPLLDKLPQGIETRIGDRGVRLSGGERQRIGLARSLYNDPEILILDEATSALDNETEKEITLAIDQLRGGKTLIIVAHRLSTVKNCDHIVFLKDGKSVATGTYSQLLDRSEEFLHFVR